MAKRTIVIDIGNTTMKFYRYCRGRITPLLSVPTSKSGAELRDAVSRGIGKNPGSVFISSVVPRKCKTLERLIISLVSLKAKVIGRDIEVPIKNTYRRPGSVGQDRLLVAYAALKEYGPSSLILDFGTALTFDLVNGRGEYTGGIIFPGIETSYRDLYRNAALLPDIALRKPSSLIGRETADSLRSGAFYGYAAVCDGITERIKREKKVLKVIATGGYAGPIAEFTQTIDIVDPLLLAKGVVYLIGHYGI